LPPFLSSLFCKAKAKAKEINMEVRDQGYNCEDLLDKAYEEIDDLKEIIEHLKAILIDDGYDPDHIDKIVSIKKENKDA
jgi:hypothetical protein